MALAQHRASEATRAYRDAVMLDQRNPIARFKLGIAYAELGYYAQAIDQWQDVLKLDPTNQSAKDNIQRARTRLESAREEASAATPPETRAQASELARQSYEQAVQLISQRRYADAVSALTAAIQLAPDFAVAYVARGSAYVGLRRYQDAVTEYEKGLALNPNQASPLFGLAEAYNALGDRPRAARYYEECTKSTAPDAASLRDLARKRSSEMQR